jgi:DNA-binding transcriptional MerR regulator
LKLMTMFPISTFAKLAGITIKALYHYERHGLICPQRTEAGYRRYQHHDLARLQRIIALKSLGLSLKQIALVQRDMGRLPDVCAQQRRALDEKRARIDCAVQALDAITRDEAPTMALDRFVGEWIWTQVEARRHAMAPSGHRAPDRVSPSKLALFRDMEAALDGPADAEGTRQLIARWEAMLDREVGGDVDTLAAMRKAWANWRNWPDGMRRYVASLFDAEPSALERVAAFIDRCSHA